MNGHKGSKEYSANAKQNKRNFWRRRRIIESGGVYEICIRTRNGLPFQQFNFIKVLLQATMARAQTLTGVKICHFVWMGNHCHLILVPPHQAALSRFYCILQKSCTDWIKALVGTKRLALWDPRPTVIALLDPEVIAERIAYIYANPARGRLIGRIEHYRGLASFEYWTQSLMGSNEHFHLSAPRVALATIPSIGANVYVSKSLDAKVCAEMKNIEEDNQKLVISPNAWAMRFNASKEAVKRINELALKKLTEYEKAARRSKSIKQHFNSRIQNIFFAPFTPKKFSRKIFVLSTEPATKVAFISTHTKICSLSHRLYQSRHKYGLYVQWPAGIFIAQPPIQCCATRLTL